MNVTEALIAGKDRIKNKKNWTQRAFARNSFGITVDHDSSNAACWCSLGALKNILGYGKTQAEARHVLRKVMTDIVEYNDNHNHDEVMQKWDEAIELSKL
jgi:hypothetical protein